MTPWTEARVLEAVRDAITPLLERSTPAHVTMDASLVDDLGLDSLKFIDLALALESRLGVPMRMEEWIGREELAQDKRFTVGSAVRFCLEKLRDAGVTR
jgi:acyl carrier protein